MWPGSIDVKIYLEPYQVSYHDIEVIIMDPFETLWHNEDLIPMTIVVVATKYTRNQKISKDRRLRSMRICSDRMLDHDHEAHGPCEI